jgi:glycosyltransferase involved in cell wall biosynthesis
LPTVAFDLATLRRAPVVWTAVSRVAAEQVAARLPAGRRAVHVLPNAVSVDARPETPAAGAGMSIVSTMRLARRKRPLPLLDVVAALQSTSDVPVRLTLVGDGAQRAAVERRARRLGLAEQVSVTGRVEPGHVLRLLARSDVYVAPAVLESFGLAALEARCVGLPVVGRLGTGLADFVEHGVNGLLCDSDDALVTALRRLAEHPELRLRMSEHNRTTDSEMTWPHTLERHDLVYDTARGTVPASGPGLLRTVTAG